jgi:hypothetical protein
MRKQGILIAAISAALGAMPALAQWRTTTNSAPGPGSPQAGQQQQQQRMDPNGPGNGPGDRDPNGPNDVGVARVSIADGDVELQRASGDRLQARGGMPLAADDLISTGRSSRAEVQLGPGNLVRLNEESRVRVLDIGNRYYRLEVISGEINVSQIKGSEADVDVMTPNATVHTLKAGAYRITVREGVQTDLTVRKGEAEISSGHGSQKVKSGDRASVRGDRQTAELRMSEAAQKDAFDRWNERRDDVLEPRYRTGGGMIYGGYGGWGPWGGYGGFGYPFWGGGWGYPYGGFYGGSTVIIGGGYRGGGYRGGGGGGRGGHR